MVYLTCHWCGSWLEHESFCDDPSVTPVCNDCFRRVVDNYGPPPEAVAG